ncbi:MAG: c-type cytochrome, partial [Pirellulales bacterium]
GTAAREGSAWQWTVLADLCDVLSRRQIPLDRAFDEANTPRDDRKQFAAVLVAARRLMADNTAATSQRLMAVRLLGRFGAAGRADDLTVLGEQLRPLSPVEVQLAVIDHLVRLGDDAVPSLLLANWKSHSPRVRNAAVEALLSRPKWQAALVESLENGATLLSDVDASQRQRMLSAADASLREQTSKLFAAPQSSDRAAVVARFANVLEFAGDRKHGATLFAAKCAACHRVGQVGHEVGPSLAALVDRSPKTLLTAMLDPNRAVEDRYKSYNIRTKDGRAVMGILAEESGASIVVVGQDGRRESIARQDIDELQSSGRSQMPEGFERDLNPRELADLIAFLRTLGPPPKSFPGNHPQVVVADANGSLFLAASNASIYGDTLVFEPRYGNLGFWQSATDRAEWSLEVPRDGEYEVFLDYACDNGSANHPFRLAIDAAELRGTIPGTGTWDDYRTIRLGKVTLTAGKATASIAAASRPRVCLLDLRRIELRPARP